MQKCCTGQTEVSPMFIPGSEYRRAEIHLQYAGRHKAGSARHAVTS